MIFRELLIAMAVVIVLFGSSYAQLAPQSSNQTRTPKDVSSSSDAPAILNKTKSVAIAGIEPVDSTLINYIITLQNLTDKDIKAVSINVVSDGRLRIMSMPQGYYGQHFIKGRESRRLPAALTTSPGTETFDPSAVQIVIESVIFEDGSYEGDLKSAGSFLAGVIGSRLDVARVLPLLDKALSSTDAVSASDALLVQLSSLSYQPEAAEAIALAASFPTLDKHELRTSVDAAIHLVRGRLLDELGLLKKSEVSAREYSDWLSRTRQYYSKWLLALSGVTLPKPCVVNLVSQSNTGAITH